jgi:uncharacterized NAD-dependent epimerase/dehydratase family protein
MHHLRSGKALVAIVALAAFAAVVGPAAAQEVVQIDGRVSWISGQRMVVSPPGGVPVTVDLSLVDQDQYRALLAGERIVVTGRLTPQRNRLIATAVQRGGDLAVGA